MSAAQGIKHEQILHFSDGHVERQITPTVFNGWLGFARCLRTGASSV